MTNTKRIIKKLIELIFIVSIFFSIFMIVKWIAGIQKNKSIVKEINTKINLEEIRNGKNEIDFDYLLRFNSDTVGYLMVDGIDINYPVVKTNNNDYYLNHSFDKNKNVAGWIFMDYRNNDINTDRNTIIYGHNMKDGSMFGKLKQLKNNNSGTIYYYTDNSKLTYKIFSLYEIEEEDYYIKTVFNDDDTYLSFLETLKGRSIQKIDYNPSVSDQIITLSTCSTGGRRFVVHAALLVD